MCINPNFVWLQRGPSWEESPVACRQCWRCKNNRVNDYTSRALAEAATSTQVATITLTYAPRDDLADKVLHPRHFQMFMKQLRNAGHKVRYLVTGEYGEKKGRAHFHAILFFTHVQPSGDGSREWFNPNHIAAPELSAPFSLGIPQKRISHIREWPHGHISIDWSASEAAIKYVCKYVLKDSDNKQNFWFSLSKKPTLGAAWFAQKAETAKQLGVLPSTFEYMPPGGTSDRKYLMTGATRRDYLNAITKDHRRRETMSDWVRKTFDKLDRSRIRDHLEQAERLSIIEGGLPPAITDDDLDEKITYDPDWVRWWLHQSDRSLPFDYRYPHSEWKPPADLRARKARLFNGKIKNQKRPHWRVDLDFSD